VPETYKPDSLVSYEMGAKTEWPELGHLTLDAAGYHIIWTNIQMETLVDGLGAAVNASKALIDGAQLSVSALPVRGLSLALDIGYQHARLAEDAPIIGGVAGDTLPAVPRFNGAVRADYRWPITTALNGSLGATLRYIDAEESDFLLAGDQYRIPAVRLLDVRAQLEMGRASLSLVAKNVTNEVGYSSIAPGPDGVYGYRIPPRTIGLYFQQELR
jgi:outer membrane receptor protein involved in Fe transport